MLPLGGRVTTVTRSMSARTGASTFRELQESGHRLARALDVDDHTTGVVADPPVQSEPLRQAVHERAEPDTLHHALDPDLDTPDRADDALTRLPRHRRSPAMIGILDSTHCRYPLTTGRNT